MTIKSEHLRKVILILPPKMLKRIVEMTVLFSDGEYSLAFICSHAMVSAWFFCRLCLYNQHS